MQAQSDKAENEGSGIFWLASYPKSGNTWFRIVLRACLADGPVDLNALATGSIASSRVWVDDVVGFDTSDMTQEEVMRLRPAVYRWSAAREKVGYHKIHDAFSLSLDGAPIIDTKATRGVVYILRNPLDVAPSFAHHNGTHIDAAIGRMADPTSSLSRSCKGLSWQLLQHLGTWSYHVTSWVEAGNVPIHVIRYEDMLARPHDTFATAFAYLGLSVPPDRLSKAIEDARFDRLVAQESAHGFRERPGKVTRFFRRGEAGGWRDTLSAEQVARIIADHGAVMRRFGYLSDAGAPL